MVPRMILCAVGVSLLLGCGRQDYEVARPAERVTHREPTVPERATPPNGTDTIDVGPAAATRGAADTEDSPKASKPPRLDSPSEPTAHSADGGLPAQDVVAPAKDSDTATALSTGVAPAMNNAGRVPTASGGVSLSPGAGTARPPEVAGQDDSHADTRQVRFADLSLTAPNGWIRKRPPLKFILAEFSLPAAEGDSSEAQLTVTRAVGDDRAGVNQLLEQLKEEEQSQESTIEHLTIAGHKVVVVDSSGDYDDETDSGTPAKSAERYRSLNAMVFLDDSVYFVNCTGPEKTVTQHAVGFRAFLETMAAAR